MTTKYVSTYSGAYYELATKYSVVHISEGDGFGALVTTAAATILNYGKIGARSPAAYTFGVVLGDGGKVVNGSTQDTHATIGGYYFGVYVGAGGSVSNFGTIQAGQSQSVGVIGETTLNLVNGANTDKGALINGGNGVEVKGLGTVSNFGDIYGTGSVQGYNGVWLKAGGRMTNGSTTDHSAAASGYTGVSIQGALGVVFNYGTIHGLGSASNEFGVLLGGGGSLTNGSAGDTSALVEGAVGVKIYGTNGSVTNFGTVIGFTHQGAVLYNGGNVTNGSLGDTHASISGILQGVGLVAYGVLLNFGAITGSGTYSGASGAQFNSGGSASNGRPTDHAATISGYTGVLMSQNGFVENFGTITGDGSDAAQAGVALENGGTVDNQFAGGVGGVIQGAYGVLDLGASSNVFNRGVISGFSYAGISVVSGSVQNDLATASIQGKTWGIAGRGLTTVSNLGTVLAQYGPGVYLAGGGAVYNGGGVDNGALIAGYDGIDAINSAVLVENFGTVLGRGRASSSFGANLLAGGVLSNGSANNSTAVIDGYNGLKMNSGFASNFGTISGQGDFDGVGVELFADANFSNGAQGHASATVTGDVGIYAGGGSTSTVTNFGTIIGQDGVSVQFNSSADDLVVEAGGAFFGEVFGDGGTLEMGSGTGTISNMFVGGDVVVSGPVPLSTFVSFATLQIDAAASFALSGNNTINAGEALNIFGTASTIGTLTNAGSLTVGGTLSGTGTLALTGGTATFGTGAALTLAKVNQSGGVASFTAASTTYAGVWNETAGTVTVASGDKVNFTGTGNVFDGTLAGAGTVEFTAGSDLWAGTHLTAAGILVTGASVTVSGALSLSHTVQVTSPTLTIAAAGATLSGVGGLELTNVATNALKGGALTNNAKIVGAGLISVASLANGGTIDADFTTGLTLTSASGTVTNTGVIENVSTGGLTITGAVTNTGTLLVSKGTLIVDGAVSGAGKVLIEGGTADMAGAFSGAVTFSSAGGTLALAHSRTDTVTITGLAKTNITKLDLQDIAFAGASVSYSGTATSGTLTVTNGAAVAHITLTGNYLTSTFTLADDGAGHVLVTDPAPTHPTARIQPLVTAMAGFGGGAGSTNLGHGPPPERLAALIAAPA